MSLDAVDAALAEHREALLTRLNVDFEDSMLFVVRILGGIPAPREARVQAVDRGGVDFVVTDLEGRHERRVEFRDPVSDPMMVSVHLLELVTRARALSGEPGHTSAEREIAELTATRTFVTSVRAVADVHPHLRRITLGGGDLSMFSPRGPDTFCYVLLPPPGRRRLTIDNSFTWEQYGTMAPDEQPVGAYYTVRAWRPDVAELDMLFVLHGDAAASGWAARAQPGDPVALWGPRAAFHPPADTDWLLLVADETGLPAVAAILEQLPAGMPARVLAEVADAGEHQELPTRAGVEVTWLHRDGRPPGTTTLLADAARKLRWPPGTPYVWGGGESRAMTVVRRHVRAERGLDRAAVSLVAYWRHATSSSPVDDPVDDPDDDPIGDPDAA